MKKPAIKNIMHFLSKYIWIICAVLVALEIVFTFGTANILMQESAKGLLNSVCGEVSGRVDGVLRLLQGLANDERISDVSLPLFDRAVLARPYQASYDLFMIALTDQDVNVISCDETEPPAQNTSLAHRDYMQKLYATGDYQITDAMVAGADHVTMNYTIAVPIMHDGAVAGSVFGSIYFDNVKSIIEQNLGNDSHFYLLGKDNTIMAGNEPELVGKSFLEATAGVHFLGKSGEEVSAQMTQGQSGHNWEWDSGKLWYVNYQKVAPTDWTLTYRVPFTSIFQLLLPGVLGKTAIYIFICALIAYFSKKYMDKYFSDINHLLNRMSLLQKEIFQTDNISYDGLLDMTKRGLNDELTGLPTRTVLFERASKLIQQSNTGGAVLFIDLDDLKKINDTYGHEAGDHAITHFAGILSRYAAENDGIAARYGGDEFILVLGAVTEAATEALLQKLCAEFCTSLQVKEHTFQTHASIGACLFKDRNVSLEELICKADLALYAAKQGGKNRYVLYRTNLVSTM